MQYDVHYCTQKVLRAACYYIAMPHSCALRVMIRCNNVHAAGSACVVCSVPSPPKHATPFLAPDVRKFCCAQQPLNACSRSHRTKMRSSAFLIYKKCVYKHGSVVMSKSTSESLARLMPLKIARASPQ
jgi:hypothetical protein